MLNFLCFFIQNKLIKQILKGKFKFCILTYINIEKTIKKSIIIYKFNIFKYAIKNITNIRNKKN